jgi:hypothetical protein
MRYAIVNSKGQVVQVLVREEQTAWLPPLGHKVVPCPDEVGIGYSYDGKVFVATAPKRALLNRQVYQAAYPVLMVLFGISYLTLMVGLGMLLYQVVTDTETLWKSVALVGFMGTWFFPALIIGLGILSAQPNLSKN